MEALFGVYGNETKNTLIKLLNAKAVHFLGTDTHRPNSLYTKMEEIKEIFIKEIGEEHFETISYTNPKAVLDNIEIQTPEFQEIKR